MPSKKLTAQKRAELEIKKQKQQRGSNSNFLIITIITVVIIIGVIGAYFIFSGNGSDTSDTVEDEEIPVVNTAPSAIEDYSVLSKNSTDFRIDALANDNDEDNDELNITSISTPTHGTAVLVGSFIYYTPEVNFSGIDSIDYTISDGKEEVTSKIHVIVADANPIAIIDTTQGTVVVELYEDKVPNTCENFIKLANDGFYSGLVFHRVIDDFMIQGGGFDADGNQKESPYGAIDLEINTEVRHVDGAIAMARTNDPNSATSQFYICDGVQHGLDDSYAAFGLVIDGLDIVREIASVSTGTKTTPIGYTMEDWPVENIFINSITIENQ